MKSFLSSLRKIDRTDKTLSSRQNSKSIDLHLGRMDARGLQDDPPASSAVEQTNWQKFYRQFGAVSLLSTAACLWQSTAVMAAPLSCSSIYADVNGGTAIYSINTTTAALTSAATLPVSSNVGIAVINVGGVPTLYSDSLSPIHLNYTNGTTTGNTTAATFSATYGGGLGADTSGRLFYIAKISGVQHLLRFNTTTAPAVDVGAITGPVGDLIWPKMSPGDMMSDANGRLYYFGSDYALTGGLYTNYLYYVDASMVAHRLGSYTSTQVGIGVAFDPSGTIYTLNANLLYKIDLTAGFSATLVGNTGNGSLIDMASCALPAMNPLVSATKTVQDITTVQNPATIVNTNDILQYNITVANTGNLPSDSTKFIDIIPAGSTYVAGSTQLCNAAGAACAVISDVSGIAPFVGTGTLVKTAGQGAGILLPGLTNNAVIKFQVKVTSTGIPASIVNTGQISYPTVSGGTPTTNTPNTTTTSVPVAVPPVTLSGTVFDDTDGSKLKNGTEILTTATGLNAVLVNTTTGLVVAKTTVTSGAFSFSNVTGNTNYTVQITTATATVGSAPPAITLPSNWVSTGENLNSTIDGTVDSILAVPVTTSNITTANFGIEQLPTTTAVTGTSQTNPGGTTQVQAPTLAGIDPEDGALGIGKSFKIISLPSNGTLYYNGAAVTTNQVISSYDPTKLTLDPTIDGVTTVSFSYAAVDAAGQVGSTATASMSFTAAAALVSITGTVFNDTDSSQIQTGTEAGTNGGGLNAVLLNSSNAVVATTTVAADGTYSFSNVSPATYTVLITTGTTATITLPTNWVSTGENLSGVVDTTVDSKLLNVVAGSSNVTGANFGIHQNPADVLLLKRITAINGLSTNPNDNTTSLTGVLVDPIWKAGYVVGAVNGGPVKPGDTIEYTIYYLNTGGRNAKSVRICDRLNANQTFYPDTYPDSTFIQNNTTNPNPIGAGMQVQKGISAALTLTNTSDSDGGQFVAATSPVTALPTNCKSVTGAPNNDYGALILDLVTNPSSPNLTTLPGRTGQGTPNDSFGLWRFITKVNKVNP
jgi:uncharacterized repeat protein (TIGR01451 family)